MILSICIPSYNRGHRALSLVKRLLNMKYDKTQIEVICSNNGSDKNIEGYKTLANIHDDRFHYYEFEENQGFAANYSHVIKMSQGDFCLLLSDEDWIVKENLDFYLHSLQKLSDFGIIRSRSSYSYADVKECYAKAGREAIEAFYMRGIYMTGTIFNRRIVTNKLLDEYSVRYKDNEAYLYYPHLLISAYALLHGHFFCSNVLLVSEGATEDDLVCIDNTTIPHYDAYERVLACMHGYCEQLRDLNIDAQLKFDMLLMVFQQTAFLIRTHKEHYKAGGYDYEGIMQLAAKNMRDEIPPLHLPLSPENLDAVYELIDSITINS